MSSRDFHTASGLRHDFATTCWSDIMAAGDSQRPDCRAALERLCQNYWFPLYAYAKRRMANVEDARDVTQAFFADWLARNAFAAAMPSRGHFRSFLLTAFQHFLSKEWEKTRTLKRGGGRIHYSLDFDSADTCHTAVPVAGLTPEQHYDRQWALTLLDQVMAQLRDDYGTGDKARQFAVLRPFLAGNPNGSTYQQAAQELGLTEVAARKAASRLRARYRTLLRRVIAATVATPSDVDDEIHNLFAVLGL